MSTKVQVFDKNGSAKGTFELNPLWLESVKGEQAIHESVVAYLAGLRAGTAKTKTRGEVSGGGKKPYKQKGTGRARAGSTRSPIWRGGGTSFGPIPRSYDKHVNKKVKRLAVRRALADRFNAGEVIVVEDFVFEKPKTQDAYAFLKSIDATDRPVVIVGDKVIDDNKNNTLLSFRNIGGGSIVGASLVNAYILLNGKKVVITKEGLEQLGERISKEG